MVSHDSVVQFGTVTLTRTSLIPMRPSRRPPISSLTLTERLTCALLAKLVPGAGFAPVTVGVMFSSRYMVTLSTTQSSAAALFPHAKERFNALWWAPEFPEEFQRRMAFTK